MNFCTKHTYEKSVIGNTDAELKNILMRKKTFITIIKERIYVEM